MALYLLLLPNSGGRYLSSQSAVDLENYLTLSCKQSKKKKKQTNKRFFVLKNLTLTVHIAFLNLSSYINPMMILASLF